LKYNLRYAASDLAASALVGSLASALAI
jgi:hypothetical protein